MAIHDMFQANQEPRAVILNQEFASLSQGDLPIEAYASQLKQTADALRDVGHPILDRQLVLNLLNSINPRLANTADIIANTADLHRGSERAPLEGTSPRQRQQGCLQHCPHRLHDGSLHLCVLPLVVLACSSAPRR
jgi:hypothetical protein